MPIPALDERGMLPPGLHNCTLDEIRERFGRFQRTDRRPNLFENLEHFAGEARSAGIVAWLLVDGSFVTAKPDPNDIDLVVVIDDDFDLAATLRPAQYNVVSRRQVRKRYKFNVLAAREGSPELEEYIAFFQQVRGDPDHEKGVLRLAP